MDSFLVRSFKKRHGQFLEHLFEASQLFPGSLYSILPTALFLTSVFAILYSQFHRPTDRFSNWTTWTLKETVFHWAYFYATRIWFIILKVFKWGIDFSDRAIEKSVYGSEAYYNKVVTHFCLFLIVLTVSLVPCVFYYLQHFNQREIPNFLMVAEDPWLRSEIGTAGHYLTRPPMPHIYNPYKLKASFRSGRSSSVDSNVYFDKPSVMRLRPVKSAISMKTFIENNAGS
ncbi:uncharacterized protein LOC126747429 isoform X2 [Anthonomus grandis grandis]|uniref:uncharacterized protein LOC126747429 isoform X2 n=1 Tax=Anthonomus grandis grandis TaxID=2921223 RepID=UPI00216615F3|nr:uncharacterized protein LOC126747429 isoform X2 [Anthonomus grandis grandis]